MSDKEADLEAYRQAFQSLRHYSSLRFTLLTAYIVISGALLTLAVPAKRGTLQFILAFAAGDLIAVSFGLTELRIDQILTFYAQKIRHLGDLLDMSDKASEIPARSGLYRSTHLLTLLIYFGSVLMWIIVACV